MAQFRVIEPSDEKLQEVCMILHNLRLFTEKWNKDFKVCDKGQMQYWQSIADQWLKLNREKIT